MWHIHNTVDLFNMFDVLDMSIPQYQIWVQGDGRHVSCLCEMQEIQFVEVGGGRHDSLESHVMN